jgi:hypothetical protein
MSDASDFLQTWIQKAQQRAPSITLTLAQRWPVAGTHRTSCPAERATAAGSMAALCAVFAVRSVGFFAVSIFGSVTAGGISKTAAERPAVRGDRR